MTDTILRTTNLGKKYRNRWAAQNINLEVHQGDVFGFLGPNGAGKSTTIRMILSLIKPTDGSVELFGHDLFKEREKALFSVGGIVEKPDFYLYLSAYRNMQIAGSMTLGRTPDKKNILETLETVGLIDRAFDRVKTYSHGMKQRLGIAQALLTNPKLVMLDEPTNGLDPQGMKEVRELITRLTKERGITVFLSSHLLNEVEQVATRMAIINKGEMVVQGSTAELLKTNANKILLNVEPKKKAFGLLKKMKQVAEPSLNDKGITARIEQKDLPGVVKILVKNNCKMFTIEPKHSLEEYFLSIT
ncbi:MAG: ABC transporter ATP-binding protein [Ignavibacteriales bacterium]|nr:ABC transporter ATP-binding protein [Ignavibacteriales bacterium]